MAKKEALEVVKNAKRNIVFSVINKVIVLVCPFIERTIVQQTLGSQYLGLGSLFKSVLTILCLSELGFGAALVHKMYKPMYEGDIVAVNALLNYNRRIYYIIAVVIFVLGIIITPFLSYLIKGTYPADIDLVLLYFIYLINIVVSYLFFAYLNSLLVVNQRSDVDSFVNSIIRVLLLIIQIVVLVYTKNFYLFSITIPIFTIMRNVLVGLRVKKLFPQYRAEGELTLSQKNGLKKTIAGAFIQKVCGVTRNSLDSICISAFLGLTLTAIYNNYYLIISGVTALVSVMSIAFGGAVGNHIVAKSEEENFKELVRLDFAYLMISGLCMILLIGLYQPFMILWMGNDMLLPDVSMLLLCLYFYLLKLGDMRTLYSVGKGIWWERRYRALTETAINLVLNFFLGRLFGVNGIILATMISLFLCNYLWDAHIVFANCFPKGKIRKYYMYHFKYFFIAVLSVVILKSVYLVICVDSIILELLLRGIISTVIYLGLYYLAFRKTNEFIYLRDVILKRC